MSVWTQKASSKGGEFEKPPAGNHPAVLVAIIDMGIQEQEYQGNVTYPHRAYFCWELVNEKQSGMKDRNHVIGIDLTISLNKKAKLRQWIEARLGKTMPEGAEYDISKELGKKCLLDVIEKQGSKGAFSIVNGMKQLPKGMAVPDPQNALVEMTFEDFKTGKKVVPDWIPYLFGQPLGDVIGRGQDPEEFEAASAEAKGAGAPKDNEDADVPF